MFLKFYRYRFVCIALLSLATIIFIGNLYYKSVYEISILSKSNDGLFHKRYHVENNQMSNDIDTLSSDEDQIIDNEDNYIAGKSNECMMIDETNAAIKTVEMFSKFEFKANWVLNRNGIWQDDFENRYKKQMMNKSRPPLKVFIVPHSHTDPGWLKTFEGYYETETSKILNLMVDKLTKHEDMRFIWTEISFLNLWWENSTTAKQNAFKKLVKSGRLEIMTGGWVMTDEANVHLYAMLDQLIEGHQWVKNNLGVAPKIGWSVDPFGQGSTIPHLLAKSGFEGAIIQRIHYNWKEWFARNQAGDFYWKSYWNNAKSSEYTLLTHNMPFDIYSTRHSCGPQPRECDAFDYSVHSFSRESGRNISQKADALMQQYSKTGSLFSHNVALVLMGGDFTFKDEPFFDEHYFGYKPIIEFINKNSQSRYDGATVQFATPSDYFNEIKNRNEENFPALIGDFFPYSDIFSSGVPAYWTGYFTTRPFHKFMSRDLEHNLRNSEILFTIVLNKNRHLYSQENVTEVLTGAYEKIVQARQNLGLFQHHDAITGTSKKAVMKDYLNRIFESVKHVISFQQTALELLLQSDAMNIKNNFLQHELERIDSETFPTQKLLKITKEKSEKIVLFNSIAQKRWELITIFVSTPNVKIVNSHGTEIPYQINPTFNPSDDFEPSSSKYQLIFLVNLSPMTLNTFFVKFDDNQKDRMANVTCKICKTAEYLSPKKDLFIENLNMKLSFNSKGFLKDMKLVESGKKVDLNINFGSYKSVYSKSGAYLFKPQDSKASDMFVQDPAKIFIVEGPIASEVTIVYGELLVHSIRISNTRTYLDNAIYISNEINFESPSKNRDLEMVMKFKTSIKNTKNSGQPEFFTDQNGFQWMPRRKVPQLEVEGNYYPITSSVFIQDDSTRLTLMTTHAQGVTSMEKGELEVMLDRRTAYDDGRGMGEGVVDSVKMQHKFILTVEFFEKLSSSKTQKYQMPSLFAHHLTNALNYPINSFFVEDKINVQLHEKVEFLNYKFSCDMHLVNLRTLNRNQPNEQSSSLMILNRLGYDCRLINVHFLEQICAQNINDKSNQIIKDAKIKDINKASLTGLQLGKRIETFNDMVIAPMEIKTYVLTYE